MPKPSILRPINMIFICSPISERDASFEGSQASHICPSCQSKYNVLPAHTMKAYMGSGVIAPIILNVSTTWGWVVRIQGCTWGGGDKWCSCPRQQSPRCSKINIGNAEMCYLHWAVPAGLGSKGVSMRKWTVWYFPSFHSAFLGCRPRIGCREWVDGVGGGYGEICCRANTARNFTCSWTNVGTRSWTSASSLRRGGGHPRRTW